MWLPFIPPGHHTVKGPGEGSKLWLLRYDNFRKIFCFNFLTFASVLYFIQNVLDSSLFLRIYFFQFTEAAAQRCSVKKVFLKILQNSQENTCPSVSYLIKLLAEALFKKRLWHRCFPVNFPKFSGKTFW